jgi:hypothetical protein
MQEVDTLAKEKAQAQVQSIINKICTASKDSRKSLIKSADAAINTFGLYGLDNQLNDAILINDKSDQETLNNKLAAVNYNDQAKQFEEMRLRDEERTIKLNTNKAVLKETYNETNDLIAALDNKDPKVAGKAFETLLQRNSKENIDNLASRVVSSASILDEKISELEKVKEVRGGVLPAQHTEKLEGLIQERQDLKQDFTQEMKQRIKIQTAAEVTQQLVDQGIVSKRDNYANEVAVHQILTGQKDRTIEDALEKRAQAVVEKTFNDRQNPAACFQALDSETKGIVAQVDLERIGKQVNEAIAKKEAVQIASGMQKENKSVTQGVAPAATPEDKAKAREERRNKMDAMTGVKQESPADISKVSSVSASSESTTFRDMVTSTKTHPKASVSNSISR